MTEQTLRQRDRLARILRAQRRVGAVPAESRADAELAIAAERIRLRAELMRAYWPELDVLDRIEAIVADAQPEPAEVTQPEPIARTPRTWKAVI